MRDADHKALQIIKGMLSENVLGARYEKRHVQHEIVQNSRGFTALDSQRR